jgi:two-component system, sporulation sensor kinase E
MVNSSPVKDALNILIIDDDEDDFYITSEYIKGINNGYSLNIEWCSAYHDALNNICGNKHDIYFVDFRLGAKTGLDLIRDAMKNKCEQPLILLTGKGSNEIDIMAMEAGAVDYLVKSELNSEKLERCIRYALGRYEFIKALRSNEQKFRSLFEKSKDSVFIADENLVFKDINPATTSLSHYDKEELLTLSLYDLMADSGDKMLIKNQLATSGEVSDKELDLLTKNKEKINCIISVSRETDSLGNHYMQGVIHDITTLKKSEKATLQSEKLSATQRLVRTLAHEVRNPLNNIYLSLEHLVPEIKDDESKFYLDIVIRNSKRISSLITELLDSSRPTEIELEKIILQNVMDESIASANDRIQLKRIALDVHYTSGDAVIMGDFNKLKIAFVNIIINAIEAMQEDEGRLSISIVEDLSNYYIHFRDNGIGISEENIIKLFEPYYTSKPSGMGLGLSSTLNIIRSHEAFIEVNSKLAVGSTFTITFKKNTGLLQAPK